MQEDWVTLWPHELLLCRQLWRNQTGPEGGILTGVPLPPGVPIAILANGGMYEMVITSTRVHVQADVALGALQATILSAPLLLQTNCVLLVSILRPDRLCLGPCGCHQCTVNVGSLYS